MISCPEYLMGGIDKLKGEQIEVSRAVFDKIAYREHPDGVLALAEAKTTTLDGLKLKENPLLMILEAVEKPGNLGAILRTADAAGIDAVIVCDPKTDIYNPNVIRASLGAVFTVPAAVTGTAAVIGWLKEKGIRSYAAVVGAKAGLWQADLKGPAALVIGAEHEGLTVAWQAAADEKLMIPMSGKIDSLNASVSAAIMAYEALRQRRAEY